MDTAPTCHRHCGFPPGQSTWLKRLLWFLPSIFTGVWWWENMKKILQRDVPIKGKHQRDDHLSIISWRVSRGNKNMWNIYIYNHVCIYSWCIPVRLSDMVQLMHWNVMGSPMQLTVDFIKINCQVLTTQRSAGPYWHTDTYYWLWLDWHL